MLENWRDPTERAQALDASLLTTVSHVHLAGPSGNHPESRSRLSYPALTPNGPSSASIGQALSSTGQSPNLAGSATSPNDQPAPSVAEPSRSPAWPAWQSSAFSGAQAQSGYRESHSELLLQPRLSAPVDGTSHTTFPSLVRWVGMGCSFVVLRHATSQSLHGASAGL